MITQKDLGTPPPRSVHAITLDFERAWNRRQMGLNRGDDRTKDTIMDRLLDERLSIAPATHQLDSVY